MPSLNLKSIKKMQVNKEVVTTPIVFTEGQKRAIDGLTEFINSSFNREKFIYGLTGAAGVGKTFALNYIINRCKYAPSVIRCTAPTHKACRVFSQAMNGLPSFTIQATFGFRLNVNIADFDYKNPAFTPVAKPKLDNIVLLIVDESSMLNKNLVEYIINTCKEKEIKVLFVGDSFQLPPVNEYTSSAFTKCNKVFNLTEIVRQDDNNPIRFLLDVLRTDIQKGTHKIIEYIATHRGEITYNENGEGYAIVGENNFCELITTNFQDEEYVRNINKYKIIAYTNLKVTKWNNFVRNIIIEDNERGIITKNDLMMSYVTLVDEYNAIIINNSEEYIINDIVNYTDHEYGFKGYLIKFQMVNGGQISSPLFVIDHTDRYTISKYVEVIEKLITKAKSASMGTRANKWKDYYNFKNQYLISQNIITREGVIKYPRDLDYGFAITSHRSQGSTYENVFVDATDIVYNQQGMMYTNMNDMLRRLYVACSRAKKQLIISFGSW